MHLSGSADIRGWFDGHGRLTNELNLLINFSIIDFRLLLHFQQGRTLQLEARAIGIIKIFNVFSKY